MRILGSDFGGKLYCKLPVVPVRIGDIREITRHEPDFIHGVYIFGTKSIYRLFVYICYTNTTKLSRPNEPIPELAS